MISLASPLFLRISQNGILLHFCVRRTLFNTKRYDDCEAKGSRCCCTTFTSTATWWRQCEWQEDWLQGIVTDTVTIMH